MDPHVAEALKTMSTGINEFTKSSSSAIGGLTSKIETMSETVTTMQEQLKKQVELLEAVTGQVGEASKSSTSTSKALKKFADKVHDVSASKSGEGDDDDEDESSDDDDEDKVPEVRYPKSPPKLDITSLGPGHQDWLSTTLWQWTQYNSAAAHLLTNWSSSHDEKSYRFRILPSIAKLHARHCSGRPDGIDQGQGSTMSQGCTAEGS